jgi:anti-anti-sigma factor
MPSVVAIEERDDAERIVLRVRGEVDLLTSPEVERSLSIAVSTGRDVVLDLSGVSCFSAAGVGVLERRAAHATAALIVVTSPRVPRVLDLVPELATRGADGRGRRAVRRTTRIVAAPISEGRSDGAAPRSASAARCVGRRLPRVP